MLYHDVVSSNHEAWWIWGYLCNIAHSVFDDNASLNQKLIIDMLCKPENDCFESRYIYPSIEYPSSYINSALFSQFCVGSSFMAAYSFQSGQWRQ